MRLFLLRHGAIENGRLEAFYGGTEVPLSPEGRLEAQYAASQLRCHPLQGIYASPLRRAKYGARCLAQGRTGCALETLESLREISRGNWVGLTPEEVEQQFPGDLERHQADPWAWREHQGESLEDLRIRVLGCRDRILGKHGAGATVALVSHLFPIRAVLADALGLDLTAWSGIRIATGSISLVEYEGNQAQVVFQGRSTVPDGTG